MQAQTFLCNATYCDFVVWSTKDLVVVRIKPDTQFIKDTIKTITQFFIQVILPELVGKWYTKPSISSSEASSATQSNPDDSSVKWCYCQGEEEGTMIYCEGESCLIKWFHVSCMGIKRIPKNKWYCPDCRKKK